MSHTHCHVHTFQEMAARRHARLKAAERNLSDEDATALRLYAVGRVKGETDISAALIDIGVRAYQLSCNPRVFRVGDSVDGAA